MSKDNQAQLTKKGFDRRDIALMLLGIGFGILGQSIYDILGNGLNALVPSIPNWGRSMGGILVFLLFYVLAMDVLRPKVNATLSQTEPAKA